ncbi:thiamine pyrophosphate-dependent dehydrogenase E1 component subunit alpha [Pseudorhodoferax sp.]|uniref:thiamine pyrophosphate-dependent dehydrogenase E1 component subunit alpha n=1 Tax=Pseudorhodoferax sp. TaxID=1993553 RepID=UPI0039E3479D
MSAQEEATESLPLFRGMVLVRRVELALSRLFADGEVPGFIHLSLGQEAVAVGVGSVLEAGDTLTTTHRGHGHVLARGLDLAGFFQEIMGKAGGLCQGRGGSMHVADLRLGVLGANGIVGAGIPIALGSALAHQVRKTGGIAVAYFGDGAMAEGVLHETLNMASLWKLPLLLVCENNGWSEFSPTERQFAPKLEDLAGAFRLGFARVDGNDVTAVVEAARQARGRARSEGAQVLECTTCRVRGHFEGDPQKYRDPSDLARVADVDPIERLRARLVRHGVPAAELEAEEAAVQERVDAAIGIARGAPLPTFPEALADVYTPGEVR